MPKRKETKETKMAAYATSYFTDHLSPEDLLKINEVIEPLTDYGKRHGRTFRVNIEVEVL